MIFTPKNESYRLRCRPGKQGLLQAVVRNQACLGGGYWKDKKNFRKHRKLNPKKKAPSQTGCKNGKLLDFNLFQANVCGIDKKKVQLEKMHLFVV